VRYVYYSVVSLNLEHSFSKTDHALQVHSIVRERQSAAFSHVLSHSHIPIHACIRPHAIVHVQRTHSPTHRTIRTPVDLEAPLRAVQNLSDDANIMQRTLSVSVQRGELNPKRAREAVHWLDELVSYRCCSCVLLPYSSLCDMDAMECTCAGKGAGCEPIYRDYKSLTYSSFQLRRLMKSIIYFGMRDPLSNKYIISFEYLHGSVNELFQVCECVCWRRLCFCVFVFVCVCVCVC